MTNAEYVATQQSILAIGAVSESLNIDGFLDRIAQAEVVAPVFDPTLFREARASFEAIKKLATAVRSAQAAHRELRAAVEAARPVVAP